MTEGTEPERGTEHVNGTHGFVAAAIAAVLAAVHAVSLGTVVPVDDDYVVYRYARNLIEFGEYAFNRGGVSVEGVTSPLWLGICALGVFIGATPALWTAILGTASAAGLAWCTARAGTHSLRRGLAWLPGLLVALSPAVAWHARAGLGTVPMAWAIAAAMLAWTDGRGHRRVGAWLAVALLFRLEAALLVLPFVWSSPRVVVLPALALGIVTAWRVAVFGTFVPAAAELKALPLGADLEYGARYAARAAREGGSSVLLALGALATARRRSALTPWCVGSGLAFLAVMVVGGDWMVYGRFYVPFAGIAAVCACALFAGASSRLARGAGLTALASITALGFTARRQAVFENRFFERWWLAVGDELRESADPRARVATSPIGAIGWRSGLEIVDVLGLTHERFHGLPPDLENVAVKGHHRFDGNWVLSREPDYLLLGNAVLQPDSGQLSINPWEADIVRDPRFAAEYVQRGTRVEADGARVLPYFKRATARDL